MEGGGRHVQHGGAMKHLGPLVKVFKDLPSPMPSRHSRREDVPVPRPGYEPKVKLRVREVSQGPRKLCTGSPVSPTLTSLSSGAPKKRNVVGRALGWCAVLLVTNLWVALLMEWANVLLDLGFEGAGKWVDSSFLVTLYGVHLFGIAGVGLSDEEWSPGHWAIGAFWLGVLGSVPLWVAFGNVLP
jgi:hypothetical protein